MRIPRHLEVACSDDGYRAATGKAYNGVFKFDTETPPSTATFDLLSRDVVLVDRAFDTIIGLLKQEASSDADYWQSFEMEDDLDYLFILWCTGYETAAYDMARGVAKVSHKIRALLEKIRHG